MNDIPKNRPRVSVDLVAFLSSWASVMQDSAHNDHNYERREISRTHEAEFREAFKQAEADADELEALRARVTELEASASEVFTAMLVEIDGHTYGLRPGAARVVREALADDPELDCTDFAKPAWWRGEAYGSSAAIAAVTRILDGKDDGRGVANEPWQSVRTRLREAMRDAGRYRWLRDPQRLVEASSDEGAGDPAWFIGENSSVRWGVAGEDSDSAIDAAMAKDGAQ